MVHYHSGIDYFTPEAGTVEEAYCLACKTAMNVQRNVVRSHGRFGHSLPEPHRKEDIFTCPLSDESWHLQITALMREQRQTVSKKLKALFQEEIDECLSQKKS